MRSEAAPYSWKLPLRAILIASPLHYSIELYLAPSYFGSQQIISREFLLAILPVYIYGQPILRKKAKPVRKIDDGLLHLVQDMFETMHSAHGIGLAANQVGSLERIVVVDVSDMGDEYKDVKPMVLLNPEVLSEEGAWTMEEGCLSIPDIRDEVERAETVRVRYKDLEFHDQEVIANNLLGRVLLHEIDHLNGVLFIDHLGMMKQKLLKGRLNKIRRGETETEYPVVANRQEVPVTK